MGPALAILFCCSPAGSAGTTEPRAIDEERENSPAYVADLVRVESQLPSLREIKGTDFVRLNHLRVDALRLKNSIIQMRKGVGRYAQFFLHRPESASTTE